MSLFGGHPRTPGFGARLPRGLVVAAVAAVTVVPLAASAGAAAPAPATPTAYSVFGSAAPFLWADSSRVPVGNLHVPFVVGSTDNVGLANSYAALAVPDKSNKTLSGDTIDGLACNGYDPKLCRDPFEAIAKADHKGLVPGHSEQDATFTGKDGKPLPGVSPVAMQQGRHAARNILNMIEGRKPQRFWYFDKGSMATIGRNKAVADLHMLHLSGLPAWVAWLFVHILFLVGFRNRFVVLFQWAWAYFTFNKGARLITRNFQAETRPPA